MPKVKASQKVYRAEFLNWIVATPSGAHVERGGYVVEVARWPYPDGGWAAMVNGDKGRVLCFAPSATRCKREVRSHFEKPRTDWMEGYKDRGEWFPLAEQGVA